MGDVTGPWTEAGRGDSNLYVIKTGSDGAPSPLVPQQCYVSIDAASWFVNKQSSWNRDRVATGTLDVTIDSTYRVALGSFALEDGMRTAPIFDRPVIPERAYVGGPITLGAFLTGIARDTVLTKLLKSAADTSLGIVAGMVESAGVAGPMSILSGAGESLIGGVQDVLKNSAKDREPYFDQSAGMEKTFGPEDFTSDVSYILLHRGRQLNGTIEVDDHGATSIPTYQGQFLRDGAWLLLRLRVTKTYSGVRPWFDDAQVFRHVLKNLVSDVHDGNTDAAEALKSLKPTAGAKGKTIGDAHVALRSRIVSDKVLTEAEQLVFVNDLRLHMNTAREQITSGPTTTTYLKAVDAARRSFVRDPGPDAASLGAEGRRSARRFAVEPTVPLDDVVSAFKASLASKTLLRPYEPARR